MNKKPLLLVGFTAYTDKGFTIKLNFIIDSMTGNPDYADVGAKLTNTTTAYNDMLTVFGKKKHVPNYTDLRNEARQNCYDALKEMGKYITNKYPANALKWGTTGYSIQTFDNAVQEPGVPQELKVKDGKNLGELVANYGKTPYTIIFELRHWKKGEAPPVYPTKVLRGRKALFSSLDAGGIYNVQVRANGTKGTSDWSATVIFLLRNVAS